MRKVKTPSSEYHLISTNDINRQIANMVDNLNMAAGSVGGFDLYALLQTYFQDKEKREEINKIIGISPKTTAK